ncbi:hypothetical protein OPV22_017114 [Ensete ventricosum]|uniref:mannosyl-glycoprotein endo-beta-N-acetylglucosaminidase n=1 Tax=Ensete ventricosum TaxID=4639 RepID=A0AAV8QML5_ENSVE|nr:hypothetical protein OPV22_017114 [Ensete ventricosum]
MAPPQSIGGSTGDSRPWDPPFDPTQPSIPISYPITTLEALASGSYYNSFHYPFNRSSVPLPPSAVALPPRRRILVCHDMKGGYTDDALVQGGDNSDAYAIWHWYLMDVFVYFSHYLVTLPPPCWTNAAHTHGVRVLGTFITEGEDGRKICDTLLSTKEAARMYAARLTELATRLGFDGWLVNMEVTLDSTQIDNLKEFVDHLSRTMHFNVPGSLLIWYDAVTIDGSGGPQNKLNQKNKPFFDLCDGILVNYWWEEPGVEDSAGVAGERRFDVYMGIDVFGRGTFGGGQWNTNAALDVLKKHDISATIFAPGWVYETNQEPDFETAQNRWWGLVEQSWGILQNYPKVLPFYSNFDQGCGLQFSIEGLQVANNHWNNISSQGFQPLLSMGSSSPTAVEAYINFEDASYFGGGSLTVKANPEDAYGFFIKIYSGQLLLDDKPVHVKCFVRLDENSVFGVILELVSETNAKAYILIEDDSQPPFAAASFEFDKIIKPQQISKKGDSTWTPFCGTFNMTGGYTLTDIYIVGASKDAAVEMEQSPLDPKGGSPSSYRASLGQIRIFNTPTSYPPADAWGIDLSYTSWTATHPDGSRILSLKISWKLEEGDMTSFTRYNVYVEKSMSRGGNSEARPIYLGFATAEHFYVSHLVIPNGVGVVRFIVQVCGVDGSCQELDKSPTLELQPPHSRG